MKACELLNKCWSDADIEIIEYHFKDKKDSPSGTARKIAKIFNKKVSIHSIRTGEIIGIHEVIFTKNSQKITLKHELFNRDVFATEIKKIAIWLINQKFGFYNIEKIYEV